MEFPHPNAYPYDLLMNLFSRLCSRIPPPLLVHFSDRVSGCISFSVPKMSLLYPKLKAASLPRKTGNPSPCFTLQKITSGKQIKICPR